MHLRVGAGPGDCEGVGGPDRGPERELFQKQSFITSRINMHTGYLWSLVLTLGVLLVDK